MHKIYKKKFFYNLILVVLFFLNGNVIYSQINQKLNKEVKIGVYVDNIYNIDYMNSSYEVIFYIWANSYEKVYPIGLLDIDKAIEVDSLFTETTNVQTKFGKKFNRLVKYKAKILNKMDISKYPFDKLNLKLDIELLGHYKGEKEIIIDKKNSFSKPFFIDKWKVENSDLAIVNTNWDSDFGDIKHKENSQLEALTVSINLKRDSWNLYLKMFLVLFISLFLAALNLFLPNKLSEEKFALIVGSLFTAIGNKYIIESYLPFSDNINLCDILHVITFIFITFYALYAIYEQRSNRKDSLKLDFKIFTFSILLYFLLVLLFTLFFLWKEIPQ
jgi:hypothetical protein